ncbi:MAG: hypothetical protein ACLTEK_00715 [Christensenellales bacterium]|jgi:hypothetical protein|nr:MAG TPA: hypothetical protein [Caudoviricetes sp.]
MTRRDNLIGLGCVVENDLFDIAARLREIDSDYFVFYSYKRRRYEVHCRGQVGGSFVAAVPYPKLDGRTLTFIRRTRSERAEKLLKEMEEENARIERENIEKAVKNAALGAERALSRL